MSSKRGASSEGSTMVGRYRIFGEIASGGMATVHIGRLIGPAAFSRTVAIKRLHPQLAKDPEFVAMLLDEARLAARIVHPNVVSTLDVVSEENELFLVMDYVVGESLAQLLKKSWAQKRPVPPGVGVSLGMDLLLGLHAAHEATSDHGLPLGIVHRDVSPQNLLVGADGVGRVVDFGVAKAMFRSSSTQDGQIKGKLTYMSPEQIQAGEVDRRSDVFSAGVVLWEALVGKRLFSRPDPGGTIAAILTEEVDPPSKLALGIPEAVDQIVMKALAKDASDRFATAGDMAAALADALAPAGALKVGQWVREVAGDSLNDRARRVAEVESQSSSQLPERAERSGPDREPEPPTMAGPTDHTASIQGIQARPRKKPWLGLALGAAILLIPVAWFSSRALSPAQPVAVSTAEQASVRPADTPAVAPTLSAPAPSASPALPSASGAAKPADPARASRSQAAPKASGSRAERPAPLRNCDPPYTVDSQGEKVFKPECF